MATTTYSTTNYLIYANSENNGDISAVIHCYESSVIKGTLYFYKVGTSIPANSKISTGALYLNYSISMFSSVVDILRNEGPLSIWYTDTNKNGGLTTDKELVGEGE